MARATRLAAPAVALLVAAAAALVVTAELTAEQEAQCMADAAAAMTAAVAKDGCSEFSAAMDTDAAECPIDKAKFKSCFKFVLEEVNKLADDCKSMLFNNTVDSPCMSQDEFDSLVSDVQGGAGLAGVSVAAMAAAGAAALAALFG